MTWRRAEVLTTVRQATDDPMVIEGIAIPYGVVSNPTDIDGRGTVGRETIFPGAARGSVEYWMARGDGGRMPYRPRHGERPVGVVEHLADGPAGPMFRARIMDSPRGHEYLAEVAAGLNGVSAEFGPGSAPPRRSRDGIVVQREIRLYGIAGSDMPAYDGARIALRDMEDEVPENDTTTPTLEPEPETPATELATRDAAERAAAAEIIPGPIVRVTRQQAIYGRGSGHSYFRDMLHRGDDREAADRLYRNELFVADLAGQMERAGDVLTSEIPGAFPNDYIPGLLTPRILKGRPMAGNLNRMAINNANPKIFPKVTTSTAVVTAGDGVALTATDLATTAITVTPAIYGGYTDVSRAVIDGADPSIDAMLLQDLYEAYSQASEAVVVTAVEAGASASGTAITAATPFAGVLGNVIKYQTTRFVPAQLQFIPAALYAVLLAQGDTSGRPFLPSIGPWNADGTTLPGATGANVLGANLILSWGSTVNVVVTARTNDYVVMESPVVSFRFEQATGGPHAIRIGVWAYLGVGTRLGGLKVTAA